MSLILRSARTLLLHAAAASSSSSVSSRAAGQACSSSSTRGFSADDRTRSGDRDRTWNYLASKGAELNPCHSPYHPAVKAGLAVEEGQKVLSVQHAYAPKSLCFGCGPSHPDGLHLQSYRVLNGLEALLRIPSKYCAFPGIVNGGIVSTVMECHGNWTAVIALMDKSCLPKPPLTVTASVFISYKEPTPPDTLLLVRSKVIEIKETYVPGMNRASVEVDVSVYERTDYGNERLLAQGTVLCKRLGALREL